MRKKLTVSILFGLLILLGIVFQTTSNAAYLEETEVNLYAVDQDLVEKFPELQLPSNLRQEYQISVKDTTIPANEMGFYAKDNNGDIYQFPSGLEIDREKGIIKPKLITVVNQNGEELYKRYDYDTDIVYVRVGEEELVLTVNVIDYSKTYVENQLKQYIDNNFKGLSNYNKALAITKYVANNYDYSGKYQSYRDMYLYKCGDCWASTNLINKMCELAGIPSHTRNGNQDAGAGSGHTNNAILVDGKVYIADAGYSGTKETRQYDFYLEDPAYTCRVNSDNTVTLLQYDGFETETLVIPSVIRGRTVTVIGSSFYSSNTIRPKSIVLPNTIKTIESLAFYPGSAYGDNLENITIPQSVTSIDYAAFSECKKLNVTIAQNGNFVVENDVLYNKDKTVLIQVLPKYRGNTTLTIPNTVKEIKKSAFFAVKGIKKVILPSTIETIANQAFYGAEIEGIKIPNSVKKIEYGAFAQNDKLISVEIEEGCIAEIGELAFASCYKLTSIKIPSTVTVFGADVFYRNWGDLVIYAPENSKAQDYANENNIKFSSGKVSLIEKTISIEEEKIVYQPGKSMKPNIIVEYLGEALVEGKDYTVIYDDNFEKPGKHQVILKGIGNFTGEIVKQYEIQKAQTKFSVSCEDVTEGETLKPQISNPDKQSYICYIYNASGRKVDKPGIPGEYTYRYYVSANEYFEGKTITQKVTIKPASIPLERIDRKGFYSNIAYVGDKIKVEIVYTPSNTTIKKNVEWESDNEAVITIDQNGNLVAVGEGDAYIYATVAGRKLSWRYTVLENKKPLESISIDSYPSIMIVGDTNTLTLKMNPMDATCKSDITWSSNNPAVVEIDEQGNIIAKKAGKATITVKRQEKTATCQITVKNKLPFNDVKGNDWFYEAVEYVYHHNMIKGINDTTFDPESNLTRGMLVTILHRMEGAPYATGKSKFSDVQNTKEYYYVAVKWATQNGIVSGYDNGTFGPNDNITREQLAVILNKYCKYKGKYQAQQNILNKFKDASKVSPYAIWGMQWATGVGVITGSNGNLNPQGTATRAETASMLYKYCLNIK